jgi:hypothetical protein
VSALGNEQMAAVRHEIRRAGQSADQLRHRLLWAIGLTIGAPLLALVLAMTLGPVHDMDPMGLIGGLLLAVAALAIFSWGIASGVAFLVTGVYTGRRSVELSRRLLTLDPGAREELVASLKDDPCPGVASTVYALAYHLDSSVPTELMPASAPVDPSKCNKLVTPCSRDEPRLTLQEATSPEEK